MNYYLIRSIEALITPPGIMLVLILLGFFFGRYSTRAGRNLILTGLFLFLLASLPVSSYLAYKLLETDPPLSQLVLSETSAEAIVILGGGRYEGYEYRKETVSLPALERLRYGAWLHKQTGLPILVTGGRVRGEKVSEAKLMAQTLSSAFSVRAKWIEENSKNTWENASFSWDLLQKSKIRNILLVTHASHMTRSKISFLRQGFEVTPAPLGFKSRSSLTALHFLPAGRPIADLQAASHEFIGRLWYHISY